MGAYCIFFLYKYSERETQRKKNRITQQNKYIEREVNVNSVFIGTLRAYVMSWRKACLHRLVYPDMTLWYTLWGLLTTHKDTHKIPEWDIIQSNNVGRFCWWIRQTTSTVKPASMRNSYSITETDSWNWGLNSLLYWCCSDKTHHLTSAWYKPHRYWDMFYFKGRGVQFTQNIKQEN